MASRRAHRALRRRTPRHECAYERHSQHYLRGIVTRRLRFNSSTPAPARLGCAASAARLAGRRTWSAPHGGVTQRQRPRVGRTRPRAVCRSQQPDGRGRRLHRLQPVSNPTHRGRTTAERQARRPSRAVRRWNAHSDHVTGQARTAVAHRPAAHWPYGVGRHVVRQMDAPRGSVEARAEGRANVVHLGGCRSSRQGTICLAAAIRASYVRIACCAIPGAPFTLEGGAFAADLVRVHRVTPALELCNARWPLSRIRLPIAGMLSCSGDGETSGVTISTSGVAVC